MLSCMLFINYHEILSAFVYALCDYLAVQASTGSYIKKKQ